MSRTYRNHVIIKFKHQFRHPKTLNEMRQVSSAAEQGAYVRHKRRASSLPTACDAKPVSYAGKGQINHMIWA